MTDVLTPGILSAACVEGLKYLIRLVKKDPTFCFPPAFYLIAVPVLNVFTPFALAWLGLANQMPASDDLVKQAISVLVASVISVATNTLVINPSTDYAKDQKDKA